MAIKEVFEQNTADIAKATELLKVLADREGQYVWKKWKGTPYKQLDYIQSDGNQYINSNIVTKSNMSISIDCQFVSPINDTWIFGSLNTAGGWRGGISGASFFLSGNNASISSQVPSARVTMASDCPSDTNLSVLLFAQLYDNTAYGKATAKIYACKFYEDKVLVRDFVPCMSSSGEIGLLDKVHNQFYSNAGTGAFTYGSEVGTVGMEIETFIDYVVADDANSYPDYGEQDGYWYERVSEGVSGISFGTITLSDPVSFTVAHGLGTTPTKAILIPLIATATYQDLIHVRSLSNVFLDKYEECFVYRSSSSLQAARSKAGGYITWDASNITFTRIQAFKGTYLWIAVI